MISVITYKHNIKKRVNVSVKTYFMKSKLLLFGFFSIILFSCSKDTAIVDTGSIRYTNMSPGGNRYEIFLDGKSLGLISANTYYDKKDVPVGSHIVKSVQHEGYLLYPTVDEKTISVDKGITLQYTFAN